MQSFKKRIHIVPHNKGAIYRIIGDVTPEFKMILGEIVNKAEIDMGYGYIDNLGSESFEEVKTEYVRRLTTIISILKKKKYYDSLDLCKGTEIRIQFVNKKWISVSSTDFFKLEVL